MSRDASIGSKPCSSVCVRAVLAPGESGAGGILRWTLSAVDRRILRMYDWGLIILCTRWPATFQAPRKDYIIAGWLALPDWQVRLMKGSKCKCGFATVAERARCPRCGKQMRPAEWPDEGKVLSFTRLQAIPEGFEDPYNLALVSVHKGPKVVCWTSGTLHEDDPVTIQERNGRYFCALWEGLQFKLDTGKIKA